MIEVTTVNGFRRMIFVASIATINEISYKQGRSKAVIVLLSNETIFTNESYDELQDMYSQNTTKLEEN